MVVLRATVGVVLLLAALQKAAAPAESIAALRHILSSPAALDLLVLTPEVALYALVAIEILAGVALVVGIAPRLSFLFTIALLLAFTVWIVYLTITGSAISCGCGLKTTWLQPTAERYVLLLRNAILLAALATAMLLYRPSQPAISSSS